MKTVKAADIMTRVVVSVEPETTLVEVLDLLLRHGISGVPVVDAERRLLGIITEHDLVNFAISGEAGDTRVREAMSRDVVAFGPDAPCTEIATCFSERRIRRVPIVQDGKVVGIVSRRDILRHMLTLYTRGQG